MAGPRAEYYGMHVDRFRVRHGARTTRDRLQELLVLQGMDAAGKDSLIRHVMSGVIVDALEDLRLSVPKLNATQRRDLAAARRTLGT